MVRGLLVAVSSLVVGLDSRYVAPRLSSCGSQALEASIVAAHGLISCDM